jgi:hypothetical protein
MIPTLALFGAACASGGGSGSTSGSRYVITGEQIAEAAVSDALEAVERLRPDWLRSRGAGGSIQAYRDGFRLGSVEALRSIGAEQIRSIRFINARDATTRWGTDHGAGAIEVVTR